MIIHLDPTITECDCCGNKSLKRSVYIETENNKINLGRKCIENCFDVNTSGNPFKMIERVKDTLLEMDESTIDEIITEAHVSRVE